ncbi:MAG: hypothetical protein Tsb009_20730 [Planctomycetaceae bacterium]
MSRQLSASLLFLLVTIPTNATAGATKDQHPVIKPLSTPPKSRDEAIQRLKAFGLRVLIQDDVTTIGSYTAGGDDVLRAIAQNAALFPKLKLYVFNLDRMTPRGLAALATLQNLTELYIGSTPVTDAGIAQLKGLKGVTSLSLMNNPQPKKITNKTLNVIVQWPRLEKLQIKGAAIDDGGLKILQNARRLSWLQLMDLHITDTGVLHLKNVPALKSLFITGVILREETRKALRHSRPKLKFWSPETDLFWNWRSGKIRRGYGFFGPRWLRFSRKGKLMFSGTLAINVYDLQTGRRLRTLNPTIGTKGDPVQFCGVACSPDGREIALGVGRDGRAVTIVDARTGQRVKLLKTDISPKTRVSASMQSLAYSADGKRLVACVEGRAIVWDLKTGKRIFARGPHEDYSLYYSFSRLSSDGQRLLLHNRSRVQLWDLKSGKMLGEHGAVDRAGFQKDGSVLAVNLGAISDYDRVHAKRDAPPSLIRLVKLGKWKPESRAALAAEAGLTAFVCNRTILIFNLKTRKVENEYPLPIGHSVDALKFSPDGTLLYIHARRNSPQLR